MLQLHIYIYIYKTVQYSCIFQNNIVNTDSVSGQNKKNADSVYSIGSLEPDFTLC